MPNLLHEPPAASVRLFLALLPDARVQAALARHVDHWHFLPDAVQYAPADWHATLHFIGPVARARLPALYAGLQVPFTPFDLRFGDPACWPHGLAVLCPSAVPDALVQLHGRLGQALRELDLKTDTRPYRAHVTLARKVHDAACPAPPPAFAWPVSSYALVESTGQTEPRYRVLQSYGPAP